MKKTNDIANAQISALQDANRELIEALEELIDRADMRFPHFEKDAGLATINKAKEALNKAKNINQ